MKRLAAAVVVVVLRAVEAAAETAIMSENRKSGTTDWRLASTARGREIEGYASLTSVDRGGEIRLFVHTAEPTYTIEIFRTGWYGGAGGRRMTPPIERTGVAQPMPAPDQVTGLIECRWSDPYVLKIPAGGDSDWTSGVYLAKLTAGTSRKQGYIIFVVRDDEREAEFLFQLSVTTWQAYNEWGGKSLYAHNSEGREARKVSFNRPYSLKSGLGTGQYLNNGGWEYNMVRWIEREGFDVTYATNVDTHRDPDLLHRRKAFLSVGHDEYWSHEMRSNVERVRDRGVHLAFFSGNTCYWQIRLEPSAASGEADRTIVCYKENVFLEDPFYLDTDPSNDMRLTTKWRRWPILTPEESMIGIMYVYNPIDSDIEISNERHWVFAGTGLRNGDRLHGLLGYEVDRAHENAPRNLEILARSKFKTSDGRDEESHMSIYTAPSGAHVFAVGTIQWAWGLDDFNSPDGRTSRLNPAAQQITRNVLHRFAGREVQRHRRATGR